MQLHGRNVSISKLRRRYWNNTHCDRVLEEMVERDVTCAFEKRGLGQGRPPLVTTDSMHGSNEASPSQTVNPSSSGSFEWFTHGSPSPGDHITISVQPHPIVGIVLVRNYN